MFTNYFKIAIRNVKRHKGYSIINISGLAVGMACCILMLLWVQDEVGYDTFHENSKNLYRIIQEVDIAGQKTLLARTPVPLFKKLKEDYPEIINSTRFGILDRTFEIDGNQISVQGALADESILDMFTFSLIEGDKRTALNDVNSVILTETGAKQLFGNEDPMDKIIKTNDRDFTVTGIMKDVPEKSHLKFNFIIPFKLLYEMGFPRNLWGNSNNPFYTYILVNDGTKMAYLNNKISTIISDNHRDTKSRIFVQPLEDIHLRSNFIGDVAGHGDIKYVYIFSATAIFILLIACINFMNLTTARAGNRAREIGLRKVVGANRNDVINQFFGEAVFLSFTALVFGIIIVFMFLPVFNSLSGKELSLELGGNILVTFGLIGIALFTGIVSGSYPALFLSSFQPIKVLKGSLSAGSKNSGIRKTLVVFQFSLSIILIICTIVVYNQLNFMRGKQLGFDKEHLLYLPMNDNIRANYQTLQNELLANKNVLNLSWASHLMTDISHVQGTIEWEGKNPGDKVSVNSINVGHDFIKTFGMVISDGRDFSREFSTDETEGFILNEEAVNQMQLENPIGKKISTPYRKGRIIGVVKNFHFKPLKNTIEPIVMQIYSGEMFYMYIRLNSEEVPRTLSFLETKWGEIFPGSTFSGNFLDDAINRLYRTEERVGTIFFYFAILTIFISCLGLLGLSSYMAEQRTKEIGIRKVLGASIPDIIFKLSKEFIYLVSFSNLIAWPAAYILMKNWLQNFAYNVQISIFIFIISAGLAIFIALITVGYQAVKAATANLIDSLKYE
ncbi:ABC transporter permease [candidate division KSB1 bacterium]